MGNDFTGIDGKAWFPGSPELHGTPPPAPGPAPEGRPVHSADGTQDNSWLKPPSGPIDYVELGKALYPNLQPVEVPATDWTAAYVAAQEQELMRLDDARAMHPDGSGSDKAVDVILRLERWCSATGRDPKAYFTALRQKQLGFE